MGSSHEPVDPSRSLREDPTDPSISSVPEGAQGAVDDPTSPTGFGDLPTSPTGFREEPTAPAGTRTVKWQAPWLATPDPPARETRPRDPLFWPVVVFVTVLVVSIGVMLLSEPRHRVQPAAEFSTSP
jgi:hypothetical protein